MVNTKRTYFIVFVIIINMYKPSLIFQKWVQDKQDYTALYKFIMLNFFKKIIKFLLKFYF